ncbi:Chaperone dnaK2 [Paramuricea clavata]|uniref:Chaperone dnaK2 n=1 Tax=Paramuricea clavata TaxID=317549 RepID=A0A7D9LUU8_PARCT|nr:Chaperone dnaK2 [Paramuricea clavata]
MSRTELLSKFDDLVKRFKEEFKEIVEGERAKIKAEIEAYQAEKQRMKAADASKNDIVLLNVGGQKFTTTRSTSCQVEGSLLATMFSGRREDGLERDEDGAVFFDVNPQYFGYIFWIICARRKSRLLRIQHQYRKSLKIKRKISGILSNISA